MYSLFLKIRVTHFVVLQSYHSPGTFDLCFFTSNSLLFANPSYFHPPLRICSMTHSAVLACRLASRPTSATNVPQPTPSYPPPSQPASAAPVQQYQPPTQPSSQATASPQVQRPSSQHQTPLHSPAPTPSMTPLPAEQATPGPPVATSSPHPPTGSGTGGHNTPAPQT
jgi:hypothetical protein